MVWYRDGNEMNKAVVYSLGNFISNSGNQNRRRSMVKIDLEKEGNSWKYPVQLLPDMVTLRL